MASLVRLEARTDPLGRRTLACAARTTQVAWWRYVRLGIPIGVQMRAKGRYGYNYARVECHGCKKRFAILRQLYTRYRHGRYSRMDCDECGSVLVTVPIGWNAYNAAMSKGEIPLWHA